MSEAFFNPEINYEEVLRNAENRANERGQIMLYSETIIPKKQNIKEHPLAKKAEI